MKLEFMEGIMARVIEPKDTTRLQAYELWMKAPNPMVTFFKTLDVTNLVKVSKKNNLKFNMLLDYCIGKAAASIEEFYLLLLHLLQQQLSFVLLLQLLFLLL